jgi:hypothetical protein
VIQGTLSSWHAQAALSLASPGATRKTIAVPVGIFFGALLLLADLHPLLAGMGAIGSGVAFCSIFSTWQAPARLRRSLMATTADGARPIRYSWTEQQLSWHAESGSGSRRWVDHLGMAENEDVLLLFIEPGVYQIFPKPWFRDAAQIDAFRALAATCLPGSPDPRMWRRDGLREWLPAVCILGGSVLLVSLLVMAMR